MRTLRVIGGGRYAGGMGDLPSPARCLTLAEIQADPQRAYEDLEAGGAILVLGDEGTEHAHWLLGVLTREPALLGEAQAAQLIADGHIPPLDELLAGDDAPLDEPAKA